MDIQENPNYYFLEKPYKSKYICCNCRKVFKRKIATDIKIPDSKQQDAKCPDCRKLMTLAGPKFRAPKSNNIKAWKSLEVLSQISDLNLIGFAKIPVNIPESNKGLKDLLTKNKKHFEFAIHQWLNTDYSEENKKQIKFFSDLIKRIDKFI